MAKATKKTAKRSVKKPGVRTGARANPKHPAATYPRAKLKLPKGVEPRRVRAAPKGKKNAQSDLGPLFDSVRASAAASLKAETYERRAAKARAAAKAAKAGAKKNPSPRMLLVTKGSSFLKVNKGVTYQVTSITPFETGAKLVLTRMNGFGADPLVVWVRYMKHLDNDTFNAGKGDGVHRVTFKVKSRSSLQTTKNPTKVKKPKPIGELKAKDFASISKLFLKYRALFAKTYPNVRHIGLQVDPSIRTSPRHFAVTGVLPVGRVYPRPGPGPAPTVRIAPELAFEPTTVQTGIIVHEIAHSVFQLNYLTEPKGYDANERATDKLAEQVTGLKIYYDSRGVEVAGKGARGKRPRPDGLR
jgi:hypothetical protein